jgi:photosystem II stability/assembly factor-like uncharacterized protein
MGYLSTIFGRMVVFLNGNMRRALSAVLVLAAIALLGCWQTEPSSEGYSGPVPVKLSVSIGKVDGLQAGLGKSSAISLQKLILLFASSTQDTIRDTLTASTTPALSATATSSQNLSKVYALTALRSWKVIATVKDARDSIIHRDSVTTAVLQTVDTISIPMTLTTRFVMYTATFNIPDSIVSVSGTGLKDILRINRLVLKVDGVTKVDSTKPSYFTANTISSITFDYVTTGSHSIQLLAYGPMHYWDSTQALYSGSTTMDVSAGRDTAVSFNLTWQGPNTGVKGIAVTLSKAGSVTSSNALPGATGLPPAWTSYDLAGSGYTRIAFTSPASTGWAVGEAGAIIKTENSGDSWKLIASNTSQNLYGLTGSWFAGDSGTVLFDPGTGICESRAGNIATTVNLRGVGETSSVYVIGSKGEIYVTSNSGTSWTTQNSQTSRSLNAISAASSGGGYAYVVGDSGVIRKLNGSNWDIIASGTTRNLRGVSCASSSACSIVGDSGLILSLTSSGASVAVVNHGLTTRNLRDVYVRTGSDLQAVGDSGVLLFGSSATTWSLGTSNTTSHLNGIGKSSNVRVIAVGETGTIRYTTSGGTTLLANVLTQSDFKAAHFPSASRGYAVGTTGAILRYTSSANKWTYVYTGSSDLNGVFFTDNSNGWAVGASGSIVKTANGGSGWAVQTSGTANALAGVYFTSSTAGWAVGAAGTIRGTTNGGTTWNTVTSGTPNPLSAIFMRSATLGWVVGDSSVAGRGIIRKTTDGGTNWTGQTSGTTNALKSVYFVNDTTGWVVGAGGTILKTTNGGTSWTAQTSGTSATLQSVYFVNSNLGFAVGLGGKIMKTLNGGTTWKAQYLGASPDLYGVAFASSTVGWAVGSSGSLMSFNP